MTSGRRHSDRRRRVLYAAHHADSSSSTAASRRTAERLRQARRPAAAYGIRVKRRLRGRWFSLVPVRRRTLVGLASCLMAITLLLCIAHYAAISWPWLAYRPEIARPFRLDQPDSFGRYLICLLLASASGVSLLIYQLRRYRIDDYRGHYRLWRLVVVVTAVASVQALVSLTTWCGALLESAVGKRVALTGADWIRLVVSIGCTILALRLIAEIRRSRWALGWMLVGCGCFSIPELHKWNVLTVESAGTATVVTAAPLLACTALVLAFGVYLRMLYREVREIQEGESLRHRLTRVASTWFKRKTERETGDRDEEPKPRRTRSAKRTTAGRATHDASDREDLEQEPPTDKRESRRGWFGRRRKVSERNKQEDEVSTDATAEDEPDAKAPGRSKSLRGFLRRRASAESDTESPDQERSESPDSESDEEPKRSRWGWSRRKNAARTSEEPTDDADSAPAAHDSTEAESESEVDQDPNGDDIDWSTLSKAERRRLRKKLKRQGRAA